MPIKNMHRKDQLHTAIDEFMSAWIRQCSENKLDINILMQTLKEIENSLTVENENQ